MFYNEKLGMFQEEQGTEEMIGADVAALYLSLDSQITQELIYEAIIESEFKCKFTRRLPGTLP